MLHCRIDLAVIFSRLSAVIVQFVDHSFAVKLFQIFIDLPVLLVEDLLVVLLVEVSKVVSICLLVWLQKVFELDILLMFGAVSVVHLQVHGLEIKSNRNIRLDLLVKQASFMFWRSFV